MAISVTWYYVCVCMLYRCSVHCEYHHYLSLFTALVPVLQDLHFRLEDIYPYCKPIVVFGIIVGSFSRKRQWVHLHRHLKPVNLSVTSPSPELFRGGGL